MEKTLILFCHPALEKSRVNRVLIEAAAEVEGVTVNDLYEEYPDFQIDVEREMSLLEAHQRIILQHPLYWYSTPALMKEWFDLVLKYGWAYGKGGTALEGKTMKSVMTAGGTEDAYSAGGSNRYTIGELMRPVECTARMCGMKYLEPRVFFGSLHLKGKALEAAVAVYRNDLLNS